MNAEQRLNLISKIAQNDHYFTDGDEYWLIGMLSDTTMSDDALMQQIEVVKTRLPKYAQFLECSKISNIPPGFNILLISPIKSSSSLT